MGWCRPRENIIVTCDEPHCATVYIYALRRKTLSWLNTLITLQNTLYWSWIIGGSPYMNDIIQSRYVIVWRLLAHALLPLLVTWCKPKWLVKCNTLSTLISLHHELCKSELFRSRLSWLMSFNKITRNTKAKQNSFKRINWFYIELSYTHIHTR